MRPENVEEYGSVDDDPARLAQRKEEMVVVVRREEVAFGGRCGGCFLSVCSALLICSHTHVSHTPVIFCQPDSVQGMLLVMFKSHPEMWMPP